MSNFLGVSSAIEKLIGTPKVSSMDKLTQAIEGVDALSRCPDATFRQFNEAEIELDERIRTFKVRVHKHAFAALVA